MELKAVFLLCFILIFSLGNLNAQTVSSSLDFEISNIVDLSSGDSDTEWAFLEDIEDRKVYIDFAELGSNFSELVIIDVLGKEVFKEDLFDMPSDSIYELDLSGLSSGEYTIELKTYTKPIYRSVSVK